MGHRRRWWGGMVVAALAAGTATARAGMPAEATVVESPITVESLEARAMYNSPTLAVDPTEARFVVAAFNKDRPDFSCILHLSGDGGRGWVPARPLPKLPAGVEKCFAPEVAFDADGRLYYLFVGLAGRGNRPVGAWLTTSTDRGRSFAPPRRVLGPEAYMVRMAIDRRGGGTGRLHLAWVQASQSPSTGGFPAVANPVLVAHSDDGGRRLSKPVQVNDPERTRVVGPALAVGEDGAVHVAYYDLGDDAVDYQGLEGPTWEGLWSLVVATSPDGGRRFGPGVVVDDALVPTERIMVIFTTGGPALVADDGGGVVVSWADARNGDWDVLVSRSGDGARSWSAPRRLNDDATANGANQYMPRLALSGDGRIDAIYYDRRHDPENLRNLVRYTSSADDGRTFAASRALSSEASDTRIGATYPALRSAEGLVEFGSRIALVAGPGGAVAAWTDTRNAERGAMQQNIVAATVGRPGGAGAATPGSSGAGSGNAVAAAAVGLAALAAGAWAWRRRHERAAEAGR